jgi:hypothetical protein
MLTTAKLLERVDALIALAERSIGSQRKIDYATYVDATIFKELRSSSLSFIALTFGPAHPYCSEFDTEIKSLDPGDSREALGILTAIRKEIAEGWLVTLRGLVAAEFFADFLEMADHLFAQGYKDPAAVLAGSVLEEHLRQLSGANEIAVTEQKDGRDVPRKADSLNADLSRAEVYNKLDQKSVTSWLDLRNKAAHGKYEEYQAEQVRLMIGGVRDFITRNGV